MNCKYIAVFAICGVFALAISCGKKEEATPPAQSETPKAAAAPAAEASKAVTAPAVEVPKVVESTAAAVQTTATQTQSMTAQATDTAKSTLEKAQALMADKKYADAISALQSLSGQSLSTENKALTDSLLKQAQQAMAAQSVSSMTGQASSQASTLLGGLLGGKTEAAAAPAATTTQTSDMAKSVIEKAQTLMADKKYADAISSLQSLAGQSLSPETKSMVDGLIAKAQQAMAGQAANQATDAAKSQATKAIGNLLGGSK